MSEGFADPQVLISIVVAVGTCIVGIFAWLLNINKRFSLIESDIRINTELDKANKSTIKEFQIELKAQLSTIHNDLSVMKQDIASIKAKIDH